MVSVTRRAPTLALAGELEATSEAGAAMVAAAGRLADEFTAGALAHDRDGTFALEHLEKLVADRVLVAPVPASLGGGGVTSTRDVLVAVSGLARSDPATVLGVNMHLAVVMNLARAWSVANAKGDDRTAGRLADAMRLASAADVIFASAVSEPGPQDLQRPATTATRHADGWRVTGRKAFATMAPHATVLSVAVTFLADDGEERYGFAMIPAGAPGVRMHDDWDALGMRASASGSVSFESVRVPHEMLSDCAPTGALGAELLDRYLVSGALHAAVSLGIAEGAHAISLQALQCRAERAAGDPHVVTTLAANVVDLTSMRASLDRAGQLIDDHHAAHPASIATDTDAQGVTAEVQAAKAFLNEAAVRVVDRALALSGGAGFLASHPLAKAWRDVRAGPFMHPMGANRVQGFLARTALGLAAA